MPPSVTPTRGAAVSERRRSRGSALVEALAAMTLMAFAGTIVAAATATSLRALRRAADLERLTAVAARELALAETRSAPVGSETVVLAVPDLDARTERRLEVTRDGDVTALTVRIAIPGRPPLPLSTRILAVQ